jgi:hypothetical protein
MVANLQPISWTRMNDAIEHVRRRLLAAARILDAAGVPYAVIGGNAVAAWVSRADEAAVRNTRDVDILLRRSDLPTAIAAFESAGFLHRRVASLGKPGHMDVFLDTPGGKHRDAIHILFALERPLPNSLMENADVSESEATGEFRLIALDALVRMKLAAWRDKDRMHLRDLASVGLVDETWQHRFDGVLRERLTHILESADE